MRSKTSRAKDAKPQRPLKLLLWAAVAGLLFGLLGMGEIAEDALRVARNSLHPHAASGDIVFVGIDDKSKRTVGAWPWPRSVQARMIDEAQRLGAKRVFVDLLYTGITQPAEDQALAEALSNASNKIDVYLASRENVEVGSEHRESARPIKLFENSTQIAGIKVDYNYQNAVWRIPYANQVDGKNYSSFAVALADKPVPTGASFPVDYSLKIDTIPYVSAGDLVSGKVRPQEVAGKTIVIGVNSHDLGDRFWAPGHGIVAGAILHVAGAETLKRGNPLDLGWLPALLFTAALSAVALLNNSRRRPMIISACAIALLLAPAAFEARLIFMDVTPALLLLIIVAGRLGYRRWRTDGLLNSLTGLPNLTALRKDPRARESALIATRVQNFAEIASTLSNEGEGELARHICARLSAGGTAAVFSGDEGVFAWYVDSSLAIGNHLEALHAMFRSPITVEGRTIDVALTFGVELGSARSAANRLGSALVAADEAWNEGLRWKYHDPARQAEMSWRLSILGQLDAAIDNGEVWIAYQPQFDLKRGRITGAEALARWTHPEKGPISPSEFVAAAEQHGRIAKLTDFVLDRAISTAAAINRRGSEFTVAVNMSARLLSDRQLLDRVQTMLKAHGLAPGFLTLELTETESLHDANGGIAMLGALRSLGLRIAIDDYGTGLSTLDYLKKVPANEIKIDQSFIKAMRVNRSDLIMVQSTIALAHSLGQTVVAEGVEDQQSLDELTALGCDVAQGYVVGRPMGVRELVQRIQSKQSRRVA